MANVIARIEDAAFKRQLQKIIRDEMPFAVALALTTTAKDAQADIRAELPKRFTIRAKGPINAIRIRPATKRKPQSFVFVAGFADFLSIHERGGIKTPRGRNIAIPTKETRKNPRQKITKAKRPRNVLQRDDTFVLKTDSGQELIVRKFKRKGLKTLFVLEPKAKIDPRLGFIDTASKTVRKTYVRNLQASWRKAVISGLARANS